MNELGEAIQTKMKYIEDLLTKIENNEQVSITTILEAEIKNLRELNQEYQKSRDDKKVVRKEESGSKTRYYLRDGSVYVTKGKEYRYLYDMKTKVVTYEFEGGQIERTFPNGIKEIRQSNGSLIIKNGSKEYDYLDSVISK